MNILKVRLVATMLLFITLNRQAELNYKTITTYHKDNVKEKTN